MAQNVCALWYASEDMRVDKWVVFTAVANNGYADGANGYVLVLPTSQLTTAGAYK